MSKHVHELVRVHGMWWCCTYKSKKSARTCGAPATWRCKDKDCMENNDLVGRCAEHAPKPAPRKKPARVAPMEHIEYRCDFGNGHGQTACKVCARLKPAEGWARPCDGPFLPLATRKPKPAKGGRWTVECRNGWDLVPSFDGKDQTIHDVVKLLNSAGLVLPARKP